MRLYYLTDCQNVKNLKYAALNYWPMIRGFYHRVVYPKAETTETLNTYFARALAIGDIYILSVDTEDYLLIFTSIYELRHIIPWDHLQRGLSSFIFSI